MLGQAGYCKRLIKLLLVPLHRQCLVLTAPALCEETASHLAPSCCDRARPCAAWRS